MIRNIFYARLLCVFALLVAACVVHPGTATPNPSLEAGFDNPPGSARLRAYWWWLNGNVTRASISRDLEEMKAKGFGGALICDAGGAEQDGNDRVPHGPTFFTPQWRELYKHALREARRLGLEMSLNIQSGWNLGGPLVTADDAAKKLTWTEAKFSGPRRIEERLAEPKSRDRYYRDLFVLAYRMKTNATPPRLIQNWQEKAMYRSLHFSTPDTTPLFRELAPETGEQETASADVLDLTRKLDKDGVLHWEVPAGQWQVMRFGCTIGDSARVSTCSDEWQGYALNVLDKDAFNRYWNAIVEPLIADAGPMAGTTLKYLHTDSWEVEAINWTPTMRAEFRERRGYDMLPFMPVLAGHIVNSRIESNRFLADYRKTLGDLAVDNHFRPFRDNAHKHNILIHPESGGPHGVPIDAQRCLGMDDAPMSEFWAWSWRHRIGDENRFFVKQPASAAHVYGHPLVLAEGFTTIGPHWQERVWDNLKPSFDKACCEGLNLLVWHAFVCSPREMGMPGQQYFAGTHFNPNSTWWEMSRPFLSYINRCQFLLQQGLFVADVCYYYGDHVPNFTQLKSSDPAHLLPGYDYDVITEEAILNRVSVRNGLIELPDGMSYRIMVLPERTIISLPVLKKLKQLVQAGATIIGPKPAEASTLLNFPRCDEETAGLGDELWGDCDGSRVKMHSYSKGRVIWGMTSREVLAVDGIKPDFEVANASADADFDYIHRRSDSADIYFVANRTNEFKKADLFFRCSGKTPELWNAVTGERRFAAAYSEAGGRTKVPLEFSPCGSWFVVFREPSAKHPAIAASNSKALVACEKLDGAWTVQFDPKWGGPASTEFDTLKSWTDRSEEGIRFYSGTATYEKKFDMPSGLRNAEGKLWLDLGDVRELAEITLNGKNLGIVWAPPFRADVTGVVQPAGNSLSVRVVNFWPNRIIGDASLPPERQITRTNIRKLTADTPLMPSGLLGPVQFFTESK